MEPPGAVLVVDDDPSLRLLCRVNLELDGWTVLEAGTLADARAALANRVDVVLLDVHVGNESGVEFLRELRRDRPGVPVALVTGSVDPAGLAGDDADAVISKPFTLETLSATVRTLADAD